MLGKHPDLYDPNKESHFEAVAKRYAMDAKLLRRRAAIHVESKSDVIFWTAIFHHYYPMDKFHFISSSKNENGNRTSGVTQCLKYLKYLNKDFFICIDSDYRYLMMDKQIVVANYVLQTYTYSFENHLCLASGLNHVCERVTRLENNIFNFEQFLTEYSKIIYDLFIWHLYFIKIDSKIFSKFEFNNFLTMAHDYRHLEITHNGRNMLRKYKQRVDHKIHLLQESYPKADLTFIKTKYRELGLLPENCYLFVRGHNIYDTVHNLCKEVCKTLLRRNKQGAFATQEAIRELYRNRHILDNYLMENLHFEGYFAIEKLEKDIHQLLS